MTRLHNPAMQNAMNTVFLIAVVGLLGCRGGASDKTEEDSHSSGAENGSEGEEHAGASENGSEGEEHDGASEHGSEGEEHDEASEAEGDWSAGDTIPSGMAGVPDIQILEVHKNGEGDVCGMGKKATLKYKAMLANGDVIDAGARPFSFKVGAKQAIKGWDIVVSRMRIGDSFTITLPQQLAYGPSGGDLKFDMELLSVD
jgi:FKBP-type peptidyl-prolyl cis-trans isomerase